MAHVESGFNPDAVSPKGACGIMQVMPGTAAIYGVSKRELFDPDTNIRVGLTYMAEMLDLFQDRDLALAAYNCGPGRVVDAGRRIPPIPETLQYVRKVNHVLKHYRNTSRG
jgi:soluble lytic murein transglycosylase-like protein